MTNGLFYLLESSMLLALLYSPYYLALRKETFFQFNRYYLLAIPVLSLLIPLLRADVVVDVPIEEISKLRSDYYEAFSSWEYGDFERVSQGGDIPVSTGPVWRKAILKLVPIAYFLGLFVCLSRTAWTLRWIRKTISKYPVRTETGLQIVMLPYPTAPFSFFNYVFVHKSAMDTPDFQPIIAHERIHVEEKHSIDSLIIQLTAAILWFNPVIWQLVKSLKATHEYIADQKVVNSGYSVTAYQILLLRQLISNNSKGLVHNFNLSFIKKRITMMKHKKSGWAGRIKLALTIAIATIGSLVIIQCNSRPEDDQFITASRSAESNETPALPVLPASGFRFKGDLADAPRFVIANDKLSINGASVGTDEISGVLEGTDGGREVPVVIEADKNQRMGFVRQIHMALRKADRRKLLYVGSTPAGDRIEVMLVLPPDPKKVPQPDAEKLAAEGKLDLFKIHIGNEDPADSEEAVYKFVKSHIAKGSQDYVVSAKVEDTDSYNDYLLDTYHIREAFYRIYQERSHDLFGKDFFDTNPDEYQKAREGVPMSISIAED